MSRISKVDRYLPMSSILALRDLPPLIENGGKPPLRAIVETDEAGGKVIRLSEGFPARRSSYGRIRLEQRSMGKSE